MIQNAQLQAKHAHTLYGPAHKLRISNLYYITYRMLEEVLEMTSSSPTFFTPREQTEKSLHYLFRNCLYSAPDELFYFALLCLDF
jgi:hypothetical protein